MINELPSHGEVAGILSRAAERHRDVARLLDRAAELVRAGSGTLVLGELANDLDDLSNIDAGAARALRRLTEGTP